ncbi:gamma-glutamylcyclotransferase [Azospirillum halopraeferens]|uniref:gamma-glutamylcyclotransferase n=1 Tax=Azospirillum halopraeferens TaxID=34010 RepID=UPI0004047FB4|nr:gamma-glutamylcyclotransferase [Azospirillum halopraeferens]
MLLDTRSDDIGLGPDSSVRPAPTWAADVSLPEGAELWVFGYGSLMWNPGFPFEEQRLAVLRGYHRRFCVASHRYRGTPERPGLVLGLDRGGCCRGMAFRVAAAQAPAVLDYLWDREMITRVYRPRLLPVRLACGGTVRACTFVVDRGHHQYRGCLCPEETAATIAACRGERGANLDYLASTVERLDALGIRDARLSALLAKARTCAP